MCHVAKACDSDGSLFFSKSAFFFISLSVCAYKHKKWLPILYVFLFFVYMRTYRHPNFGVYTCAYRRKSYRRIAFFCTRGMSLLFCGTCLHTTSDGNQMRPVHTTQTHNKHHHHGGRSARPSSDMDLMNQDDRMCGRPGWGAGREVCFLKNSSNY